MSFTIEKLRTVRTIVSHRNCPDGTASALILHDALADNGKLNLIFAQYGTEALEKIPVEAGMIFCDITPPPDRTQEFVDAGALVLDHHKTAESTVRAYGENGIFSSEPGVSGAMLAYREVWHPIYLTGSEHMAFPTNIEGIALLAGIRDTWQKEHVLWLEACHQAWRLVD